VRSARDGALALADEIARDGGTAASVLREPLDEGSDPGPAQIAADGPRADGHQADYELLVEMIDEGSRLHYGAPRVLSSDDSDLALLLGDQLYAMGLSRLAELGDLEAVAELADLISLVAQVEASGGSEDLSAAIWRSGARAIGWGTTPEHEAAKALVRTDQDGALKALQTAAARLAS
jgi:hypothetical protein